MGEYDALFDAEPAKQSKPGRGEYAALFEDAPPAPAPGLIGSRGLGPGSIAPELDATELPKVGMDRFSAHPKAMTDTERKAAQARGAMASHTDDPGVQAIIGGIAGTGASNLIGAGAAGLGAAGRISRVAQGAGAGATASKVQGGDALTGALLGGAGAAVPEVAGALATGASNAAKASVARSAARQAESATPIRDAFKGAAGEIKSNAKEAAGAALLGHGSGHGAMGNVYAAARLGLPLARAGGVAADEGVAAIARRLLSRRGGAAVAEPVGPLQSAAWDPEGWKYDQATSEPAKAAAPAPAADDPIAIAREALKDPNIKPAQADALKKAIAGYELRAAPAPSPLAEKAAALQEVRSSGARPELWGGRPANVGPAPTWEPGPGDERFAKGLGMTVDDYRALMARRAARVSQ